MRVHCPGLFTVTLWWFWAHSEPQWVRHTFCEVIQKWINWLPGKVGNPLNSTRHVTKSRRSEKGENHPVHGGGGTCCICLHGQILNRKLWMSYQTTTDRNFRGVRLFKGTFKKKSACHKQLSDHNLHPLWLKRKEKEVRREFCISLKKRSCVVITTTTTKGLGVAWRVGVPTLTSSLVRQAPK